jgi:hypothetical protein
MINELQQELHGEQEVGDRGGVVGDQQGDDVGQLVEEHVVFDALKILFLDTKA